MDQPAATAPMPVRPPRLHPPALAGVVLTLCLAMTWQLWHGAEQARQDARHAAFELRAREAASQLSQRMSAYVQLLKGVQGLFASSQAVTRSEFADFVFAHDLDRQLPGVQAIGFMAVVPAAQRAAHVAQVLSEGVDGYRVWPVGERATYAPITYIEPLNTSNFRALGYDGWSDPVRRAMLAQARDTGQPAMSGPVTLLQEEEGQPLKGFVIALPVYRNGVSRVSLEQRRAALVGWVVAPFSAAAVLAGLEGIHTAGLRLELVDGAAPDAAPAPGAVRSSVHKVAVGPQRMRLRIDETAPSASHADQVEPAAIGLFGLGVTLALTLLTWMLARSSVTAGRALGQARSLAHELELRRNDAVALADAAHHAQALTRSILDATIEGILVDDGAGRVLASNERFREMWSVPPRLDMAGDDLGLLEHMVGQLAQAGPFLHSHSLPLRDAIAQSAQLQLGDGRFFEQTLSAVRLGQGSARLWSYRDITERKQIEQRERGHRAVLELLGHGAPLAGILEAVVLSVEGANTAMRCAIMLLDGDVLTTGAAPNLPEFFRQALDGIRVGPTATACGVAAYLGERVITEDIRTHPYWHAQREVAERAGLRACWAEPIRGASGRILGSFAIYHGMAQYPSAANVMLIEQAAQLAGIALEQAEGAQAGWAGQQRFDSLYRNAPLALWELDWSEARERWRQLIETGVTDLAAWLREHPDEVMRLTQLMRIVGANPAARAQVGAPATASAGAGADAAATAGANTAAGVAASTNEAQLTLDQIFGRAPSPAFADAVAALAGGAAAFHGHALQVTAQGAAQPVQLTLLTMPGHTRTLDLVVAATLTSSTRKHNETS